MRFCIVFDCLYPYTAGGAERWYRNLAERLVAEEHAVTYRRRSGSAVSARISTPACGS